MGGPRRGSRDPHDSPPHSSARGRNPSPRTARARAPEPLAKRVNRLLARLLLGAIALDQVGGVGLGARTQIGRADADQPIALAARLVGEQRARRRRTGAARVASAETARAPRAQTEIREPQFQRHAARSTKTGLRQPPRHLLAEAEQDRLEFGRGRQCRRGTWSQRKCSSFRAPATPCARRCRAPSRHSRRASSPSRVAALASSITPANRRSCLQPSRSQPLPARPRRRPTAD